jgi:hypothetical protein
MAREEEWAGGGRSGRRRGCRLASGGVVVEAATLRVRVSRVRGSGFRRLHCPAGLEMKG